MSERGRDTDALLADWQERALLALFAYNRAASRATSWDVRIGGSVAVLTALIGTAVFATLTTDPTVTARIIVGIVSVAAAVLAGVQAFAGFPQRIEDYRNAARRYGAIRRDIEQARVLLARDAGAAESELTRIRNLLDDAAELHPNAPRRIWERTRRHIKGDFTRRERLIDRVRGVAPRSKLGLPKSNMPETDDTLW